VWPGELKETGRRLLTSHTSALCQYIHCCGLSNGPTESQTVKNTNRQPKYLSVTDDQVPGFFSTNSFVAIPAAGLPETVSVTRAITFGVLLTTVDAADVLALTLVSATCRYKHIYLCFLLCIGASPTSVCYRQCYACVKCNVTYSPRKSFNI